MSKILKQMLGREPEPFWMSLAGAIGIVFGLPFIITLYFVALVPSPIGQHHAHTHHHQQQVARNER